MTVAVGAHCPLLMSAGSTDILPSFTGRMDITPSDVGMGWAASVEAARVSLAAMLETATDEASGLHRQLAVYCCHRVRFTYTA